MKWKVQLSPSKGGQQALSRYMQTFQHLKNYSLVTMHNYLADLRQNPFWRNKQEDSFFALHDLHYRSGDQSTKVTPLRHLFKS